MLSLQEADHECHLLLLPVQITLYKEILKSKTVSSLLESSDTKEGVLHIITLLKKLCNHPDLLRLKGEPTLLLAISGIEVKWWSSRSVCV